MTSIVESQAVNPCGNGIGVRYQLVEAPMPGQGELAWIVFGGDDGSVLVCKTENPIHKRWVKLKQTRTKDHGYWGASIKRAESGAYFQPDVQLVVLYAFEGPPPSAGMHAMHRRDDADNNCRNNLRWGSKSENQSSRHQNQRGNASEQAALVGTRISLQCAATAAQRTDGKARLRTVKWFGEIESPSIPSGGGLRASGTNPSHVVRELLYRLATPEGTCEMAEKRQEIFADKTIQGLVGAIHQPVGFDIDDSSRAHSQFEFLFPTTIIRATQYASV